MGFLFYAFNFPPSKSLLLWERMKSESRSRNDVIRCYLQFSTNGWNFWNVETFSNKRLKGIENRSNLIYFSASQAFSFQTCTKARKENFCWKLFLHLSLLVCFLWKISQWSSIGENFLLPFDIVCESFLRLKRCSMEMKLCNDNFVINFQFSLENFYSRFSLSSG